MSRKLKIITATSLCILLAACGGGGGGDDSPGTSTGNISQNGNGTGGNSGSPPATPTFTYDATARFNKPSALHLDNVGNLLAVDDGNGVVRRIAPSGEVSTLQGRDLSLVVDAVGNIFKFEHNDVEDPLERDSTGLIKISPDGTRNTIVRYVEEPGSVTPLGLQVDAQGQLYVLTRYRTEFWIHRIDPDNPPADVSFFGGGPEGLVYHLGTYGGLSSFAVDAQGNVAVARYEPLDNALMVTFVPVSAQPAEGSSAGTASYPLSLNSETHSAAVKFGKDASLYVMSIKRESVDSNNAASPYLISEMRIRKMSSDGNMTTVLNGFPDGRASSQVSESYFGFGMDADTSGNVYMSDSLEHAIYKITPGGQVSLFAGKPEEAGSSD